MLQGLNDDNRMLQSVGADAQSGLLDLLIAPSVVPDDMAMIVRILDAYVHKVLAILYPTNLAVDSDAVVRLQRNRSGPENSHQVTACTRGLLVVLLPSHQTKHPESSIDLR